MSVTQQTLAVGRGLAAPRTWRKAWFGGLHGADYVWAIAFALPYVAIFLAFVVYPIAFGLWMGSDLALYEQLFTDPRYLTTVLNTLLYVVIGVNVKMFLAFLLSGFFIRKGWWIKGLMVIFILPWATPALPAYMSIHWFLNGQWGMLNNILYALFEFDGPTYLNEHWTGLASNIGAYIWKTLPFWTVILLAGRMAVPHGALRSRRGRRRHGPPPVRACHAAADGESLSGVHAARHGLRTRRLQFDLLRLRRWAGDVHRGARHPRHSLRVHPCAAPARRGGRDVGVAGADPARDHPDARLRPSEGQL